jgi:hypothetical protein
MVFPVRCISSVSPRFSFRRHAFCFLPLATILESLKNYFKKQNSVLNFFFFFCIFWDNISWDILLLELGLFVREEKCDS